MSDSQTERPLPAAAQDRLRADFVPAPPQASLEALRTRAALVTAPAWLPISIHGPDAADYLHRRLSRAVKSMLPGSGAHALQLAGDGRIQAELLLYRTADSAFIALAQEDFAEAAFELIEKYVLMDDVAVEPLWQERAGFAVIGPAAPDVLAKFTALSAGVFTERGPWSAVTGGESGGTSIMIFADGRWGLPALHVSVPAESLDGLAKSLRAAIAAAGGAVAHPDAIEFFRIERGVAAFGLDMSDRTLPLETNLRDALDLDKGCFPGQEFLARINNLGHPARVMARLRFAAATPQVGDAVTDPADAGAEAGIVTSVARIEGMDEGLAFASLPWKLRGSAELEISSQGGAIRAVVEIVGDYPDAGGGRRAP
jgi:tRNA-modifying protein YgfZ